jgi:hypothetical protein
MKPKKLFLEKSDKLLLTVLTIIIPKNLKVDNSTGRSKAFSPSAVCQLCHPKKITYLFKKFNLYTYL